MTAPSRVALKNLWQALPSQVRLQTLQTLSRVVPALWRAAGTSHADRKAIVRCLVERVVVEVRPDSEYVDATIHWQGGFVSQHEIVRPVRSYAQLRDHHQLLARVRQLHGEGHAAAAIVARQVGERFQPDKIILFGSHAYGTPHADSDVDILVVMPARSQHGQAVRIRWEVPAPFPLGLIVRTPKNLQWRLQEGESFHTEIVPLPTVFGKVSIHVIRAPERASARPRLLWVGPARCATPAGRSSAFVRRAGVASESDRPERGRRVIELTRHPRMVNHR